MAGGAAPRSMLAFWLGGAAKPTGATIGVRSMLAFWSGGASVSSGVVVTPPTTTTLGPEGAGSPVKQPRGQTHAPAFGPKRARELKDFLFPVPQPEGAGSAQPSVSKDAERGTPVGPSPLPILADFGAGPVTIGLKLPSRDEIARLLEADDEEAIIATLIALGLLD